jgi:hypothetical protein
MFGNHHTAWRKNRSMVLRQEVERGAVLVTSLVRRIEKHDLRRMRVFHHRVQQLADAAVFKRIAALLLQRGQVRADRGNGLRLALSEPAERRTAAQRLDPHRT